MRKFILLICLIPMITGSCRSAAEKIRTERNFACAKIPAKPGETETIECAGDLCVRTDYVNRYIRHARGLRNCLAGTECDLRWTQYFRLCETERRRLFENSLMPGMFAPNFGCSQPRPVCRKKK